MSAATEVFAFTCGCTTATVLPATNENAVLVCPLHPSATVAPFDRPPLWEGKLSIEIMLRTDSEHDAWQLGADIEELILAQSAVRGVTSSLQGIAA